MSCGRCWWSIFSPWGEAPGDSRVVRILATRVLSSCLRCALHTNTLLEQVTPVRHTTCNTNVRQSFEGCLKFAWKLCFLRVPHGIVGCAPRTAATAVEESCPRGCPQSLAWPTRERPTPVASQRSGLFHPHPQPYSWGDGPAAPERKGHLGSCWVPSFFHCDTFWKTQ